MWTGLAPQNSLYAPKIPAEAMTTMSTKLSKANACMSPKADSSHSTINAEQNWRHQDGDGFYNPHYGRRSRRVSSAQSFAGLLKLFEHEIHLDQPIGSCANGNTTINTQSQNCMMNVAVSGGIQQMINRNMNSAVEYVPRFDEGNDTPVQFTNLPDSLQLEIFSYLGARTLCFVARVCQHWCMLTADDLLWQRMLNRDITSWHMISHMTSPDMYEECQSDWSFKNIYLRCSPEVNAAVREQNVNFHQLSHMLRSMLPKKTQKLVMFGPGLESRTSGIATKILEDTTGMFKTVGMFPGQFDGVGSGFTIKMVDSVTFHLVTLYTTTKKDRENFAGNDRLQHSRLMTRRNVPPAEGDGEESSAQYELQPGLKGLCRTVDAFVFVHDASLDVQTANTSRTELHALVNDRSTQPDAPVIVLSCVPADSSRRASCIDVMRHLDMGKFNRPWQVHNCVVQDMAGVTQAINWLVEQARRK